MGSKSTAYARFRRALTTGNLFLVRGAARELPQVPLDDALRIGRLMAGAHDPHYQPAAIRWLARLCLERLRSASTTSPHLLAAFEALPTQPTEAWAALTTICARHGIPTDAHLA